MRKLLSLLLWILVCGMILISCENQRLRKQVKDFMSKEVVLPTELTEIVNGKVRFVKITVDKPLLIVFYGNDECSSCAINKLKENYQRFSDIEQSGRCKVVVLFSPSEDDAFDVQDKIKELMLPFPLYVDLYGDFYRANKDFPTDLRFHSFLMGKDSHPVFVGNPIYSADLSGVFEKVLNKISSSE